MYVIYALVDPRDNTVRYVGVTNDVYQRFLQHIQGDAGNYAKNAWMHELRAANKMVIMETLEEVGDRAEAYERESYWIKHFEHMKEPLMNINKTSSARKSKRTNLRLGRAISIDIASAAVQAMTIAQLTYPIPEDKSQQSLPEVIIERKIKSLGDIPPEKLETIARMKKAGESDRKIAAYVGLSGRKYGLYQAAVQLLESSVKDHERM